MKPLQKDDTLDGQSISTAKRHLLGMLEALSDDEQTAVMHVIIEGGVHAASTTELLLELARRGAIAKVDPQPCPEAN